MYPILIKCAVVFSILIAHFLLTTKIQKIKDSKFIRRTLCVITAIITFFLMLTPFENTFLQATTPEKVFDYTTEGSIIAKEEGTDSCALLYKTKTGTFSTMILTKNGEKYKKHASFTETINLTATGEGYSLHIYIRRAKNSSDYYILIGGETSNMIEISDTLDTSFEAVYQGNSDGKTHLYYLEKIDYAPETYTIYVNGTPAVAE